jgi:PAS domain S-box-containing protein
MKSGASLFEQAVHVSLDAIVFTDMDGRLTYVNPAFLKIWGHRCDDDVLGRHYREFVPSADEADAIVAAIRRDGRWCGRSTGLRKDGEVFPIEISSALLAGIDGAPCAMMASIADRTVTQRAEDARRESEANYRSLVETAIDPVFTCDIEGRRRGCWDVSPPM